MPGRLACVVVPARVAIHAITTRCSLTAIEISLAARLSELIASVCSLRRAACSLIADANALKEAAMSGVIWGSRAACVEAAGETTRRGAQGAAAFARFRVPLALRNSLELTGIQVTMYPLQAVLPQRRIRH
ncbi:MAG TPA: hypothetical protein VKA63_02570, partial [Candidatus Krumholzibacteria bacterium]|nr:hypothetical protein [Candidatus Krumholzibacteria bacterium]